jgi:hypothetical protein
MARRFSVSAFMLDRRASLSEMGLGGTAGDPVAGTVEEPVGGDGRQAAAEEPVGGDGRHALAAAEERPLERNRRR